MTFTRLAPNLFMQGLLGFCASIAFESRFFAAAGDVRVSVVDVRDIAAAAVAALTTDGPEGRIYDITGLEARPHIPLAAQFSEVMGEVMGKPLRLSMCRVPP